MLLDQRDVGLGSALGPWPESLEQEAAGSLQRQGCSEMRNSKGRHVSRLQKSLPLTAPPLLPHQYRKGHKQGDSTVPFRQMHSSF